MLTIALGQHRFLPFTDTSLDHGQKYWCPNRATVTIRPLLQLRRMSSKGVAGFWFDYGID